MREGASDETWQEYRRAARVLRWKWRAVGFSGLLTGMFGFILIGGSEHVWMFMIACILLVYVLGEADLRALSKKHLG